MPCTCKAEAGPCGRIVLVILTFWCDSCCDVVPFFKFSSFCLAFKNRKTVAIIGSYGYDLVCTELALLAEAFSGR